MGVEFFFFFWLFGFLIDYFKVLKFYFLFFLLKSNFVGNLKLMELLIIYFYFIIVHKIIDSIELQKYCWKERIKTEIISCIRKIIFLFNLCFWNTINTVTLLLISE